MSSLGMLQVSDLMTHRVRSVRLDTRLIDAARLMADAGVSSLVVQHDRRPIGIITERDMVRFLKEALPGDTHVAAIMTAPVVVAAARLDFHTAYGLLREHRVRHLVAIDDRGETAGIVSLTDFRSHLGQELFVRSNDLRTIMDRDLPSLPPDLALATALDHMVREQWDYVLVVDGEQALGIITERDIPRLLAAGIDIERTPLAAAMSSPLHAVAEQSSVLTILEQMDATGFRHIAVIDGEGKTVGMISQERLFERLGMDVVDELAREHAVLAAEMARFEDRLGLVLETTGVGVWEYDRQIDRFTWSSSCASLLHCPTRTLPMSAADLSVLVHPDDRHAVAAATQNLFTAPDQLETQLRIRSEHGGWAWIRLRGRAQSPGPDSRVTRAAGTITDITATKSVEEALHDREEIFSAIVGQARDGIVLVDLATLGFAEFNDAACRDRGYTRAEFSRLTLSDVELSSPSDPLDQRLLRLRQEQGGELELRHRCKSGTALDVRSSARILSIHGQDFLAAIWTDITARKAAERALLELQERFSVAFRASPVAATISRLADGRYIDVNPCFERDYGWQREECIGRTAADIGYWAHPDDRGRFVDALQRDGVVLNFDADSVDKGGQVRPVSLSAVLTDLAGEPHILSYIVDLGARRRIEEALRASEYRFRTLFEEIRNIAVQGYDATRKVIFWNRASTEFYGYSAEEALGRPLEDLIIPEALRAQVIARHEDWLRSGIAIPAENLELLRKDGTLIPVFSSHAMLRDAAGRPEFYCVDVDLRPLQESEFRYRELADSGAALIWASSLDKGCHYFNQVWLDFTGRSLEQERGYGWTEGVHPADLDRCVQAYNTAFERREPFSLFYRLRRHDGEYRWLVDDGKPRFDSRGTFLGYIGHCIDFTERKRAEDALGAQKKVLELVAGGAPLAQTLDLLVAQAETLFPEILASIQLIDADGRHLRHGANGRLPAAHCQAIDGAAIGEGVGSCGTAAFRRETVVVEDIATDPLWTDYKTLALVHDLRACWSTPIVDAAGQVLGTLAFYRTVAGAPSAAHRQLMEMCAQTAALAIGRERTERELRKLTTAVDQSTNGIVVTDTDGRIEYVNKAFSRISGYHRDEVLGGKPSLWRSDQTPLTTHQDLWQTIKEGKPWHGELVNRNKDGGLRTDSIHISPVRDGQGRITHYLSVQEDITERKRIARELERHRDHLEELVANRTTELEAANRRLQASDLRLTALFNLGQQSALTETELLHRGLTEAVRLSGSEMGYLRLLDTSGRQTAMLLGRADGSQCCLGDQTCASCRLFASTWAATLASRQAQLDNAVDAAPGPCLPACPLKVRRHLSIPVIEGETVQAILGLINRPEPFGENDLLELQLIGSDLWRIVMRRRAEAALESARDAAESASRSKSAFLANMSHEIRTPMNAIIGLNHLLQREVRDPRQLDQLRKISESARHLLDIINDVLDISKIEAGKIVLERRDLRLETVFDHVASMLAERLGDKGLTMNWELDPALAIPLSGDSLRLGQILLNFAGNAVKFTDHGHITLNASAERASDTEFIVRFSVTDTGIGIPEDVLTRLFDDFEQADASTTRKFGGTGLGLAISKRLAQLMGGTVGVTSQVGVGSTFWFTSRLGRGSGNLVPEIGHSPTSATLLEQRLAAGHRGVSLLLAEDNAVNREVVLELLGGFGFAIDTAENGAEAVDKVRSNHHYDLILMDMQMPVVDGLEATRTIRQLPQGATLPILALTANAFDEDRLHCLEAGMNDHIAKPVEPTALYSKLLKWLPAARPVPAGNLATSPAHPQDEGVRQRLLAIANLDAAAGLQRLRGKLSSYVRLLRMFIDGHRDDGQRLREQLAAGDMPTALRLAHSLKGAAGMVGAATLQGLAATLERGLQDGQDSAPAIANLETELTALVTAIEGSLEDRSVGATTEPAAGTRDAQGESQLLEQLAGFLADDDARALTLCRNAAIPLRQVLGTAFDELAHHLAHFDFRAAEALVKPIRTGATAPRPPAAQL